VNDDRLGSPSGVTSVTAPLTRVAHGFDFPTSVAFDDAGTLFVAESGLPFGGAQPGGRVWRLDGTGRELVADGLRPPVNGLTAHEGALYVSEGGHPARIARIDDRGISPVIEGLPGPGNYHTNMCVFGPDGKLYFSQGAMTNAAIVGLDAYELGWLRRLPHAHDVPGLPVRLTGVNAETPDPLAGEPERRTLTGAFAPFGTPTKAGDRVPASVPCTAGILRCDPDGGGLELVAGLNPIPVAGASSLQTSVFVFAAADSHPHSREVRFVLEPADGGPRLVRSAHFFVTGGNNDHGE